MNWKWMAVGVALILSTSFAARDVSAEKRAKSVRPAPIKELAIGQSAPLADVKLAGVSGKETSLRDLRGPKGLLVVFSCNTCPFVVAWEDRYLEIAALCKEKGIGMVAVNSNEGNRDGVDSLGAMQTRAGEKGYTFPYVADSMSRIADAFGAGRTPHIFLFDRNLKLVYRGAIDDNSRNAAEVKERYLANAIDALAGGRKIAVNSTNSIGCSIKRKG